MVTMRHTKPTAYRNNNVHGFFGMPYDTSIPASYVGERGK